MVKNKDSLKQLQQKVSSNGMGQLNSSDLSMPDFSSYPLGNTVEDKQTIFRFFSPRSEQVTLIIYREYSDSKPRSFNMVRAQDDIWSLKVKENLTGCFYAFKITAPQGLDHFLYTDKPVADPFCRMAATVNNYRQEPKSLIIEEERYDWEGDEYISIDDPRDLIIYECHLKDMTFDSSARCNSPGTYKGLVEPDQRGGIRHLKKLGVTAVELLPLNNFAYYEPPYNSVTPSGFQNTWNYYSTNYWGYMSSFYFVPETMYANNGTNKHGTLIGTSTDAIKECKDMVKELHREGIAVIMDVVYNHVSQYDQNPLKFMDLEYFFHIDNEGHLRSNSGTGNDLKTYQPISRQLIVESLKYWMEEFHIDGFRFDLANMIDRETIDIIREELLAINPNAILIAEPWGDGYNPTDFSDREWAAWNDQIRNGVKGSEPTKDRGFIFGEWQHGSSRQSLENFIRGTLISSDNGRFNHSTHSVNYLEAHDGYTLGDFIRIGLNPALNHQSIDDKKQLTKLTNEQNNIAKLAALYLFCSQGITMIHEGQEWARAKVISPENENDPDVGKIDHNSYEKDNDTNYLNYDEISLNKTLFEYYQGLIRLRKKSPALRKANPDDIKFHIYHDPLHITFSLYGNSSGDSYDYFISLNGNRHHKHEIVLPEGYWELISNQDTAGNATIAIASGSLIVDASSGVILRKLRDSVV